MNQSSITGLTVFTAAFGARITSSALVIVGVTARGQKRLLVIEDGVREPKQSWREGLLNHKSRGINAPKRAIGDGAMGFCAAMDEVYPETRHQRCWQHKTMNMLNCLPKLSQPKAKAAIHSIWQAETKADAEKAFDLFIETYEPKYPKAGLCLQKDWIGILRTKPRGQCHSEGITAQNTSVVCSCMG